MNIAQYIMLNKRNVNKKIHRYIDIINLTTLPKNMFQNFTNVYLIRFDVNDKAHVSSLINLKLSNPMYELTEYDETYLNHYFCFSAAYNQFIERKKFYKDKLMTAKAIYMYNHYVLKNSVLDTEFKSAYKSARENYEKILHSFSISDRIFIRDILECFLSRV